MTVSDASNKFCPFKQGDCITSSCMLWVTTVDGKKEVDRYKMPYAIYPRDEGIKHRQLIDSGYIETTNKVYIKYKECYEGYCALNKEVSK